MMTFQVIDDATVALRFELIYREARPISNSIQTDTITYPDTRSLLYYILYIEKREREEERERNV